MTASQSPSSAAPCTSVCHQIRAGVTHPAGGTYLLLWLAAAEALVLRGNHELPLELAPLAALMNLVPILVLLWLTLHSPETDAPRHRRVALWLQVVATGVILMPRSQGLERARQHHPHQQQEPSGVGEV